MMQSDRITSLGFWLTLTATAAVAFGQQPETTQPATAPAQRTPITARVLEVRGEVRHAPLDSEDWQPCAVEDEYPELTVILTGLRSSITLQLGADDTYAVAVVESVSRVVLSELYQTEDAKRMRIGVGYGRIRAGVAEGGLKSDFTVDCPVATLAKRGTWDFGLFYERDTDRFEIFLLDQGLIEAFNKVTGLRRELLPREVVTQTMRRWADEAQFRRNVPVVDLLGQADVEVAFNTLQQSGLRVLNPEGGQQVLLDLSGGFSQARFAELLRSVLPAAPQPRPVGEHREGYFGTGRGDELIPLVIESNSPLATQGSARPGRYLFRRAALEGWLDRYGRR